MVIPASQKMVPPQPACASAERVERGHVGEHVEPVVLDRAVD
jgi:hypothetical protein